MSSTIDRVHYYERQYLRSYDLTVEQLYHIEMRRRLNLALHLWGIVDGLDLQEDAPVAGLPTSFHISRGMAIDAYGREIVVPIDYRLTSEDLERNRIQIANTYFLSVVYTRELATPPAGGYRVCDIKDQYTRWRESFDVRITAEDPTPQPSGAPAVVDPLSDDPDAEPWPVVLGTIVTATVAGKLAFSNAKSEQRRYVGVRAQRVVVPSASVTSTEGKAEARLPLSVGADVLAAHNVFVGSDFTVANTSPTPPPVDPTKSDPPGTGTLKISDKLFLQGEFYAKVGGDWLTMKDYLQSFIPDVQVGRLPAVIPVPNVSTTNNSTTEADITLELTTRLQNPASQTLSVAIASIDWASHDQEAMWDANSDHTMQPKLRVDVGPTAVKLAANKFRFTIHYEIEPTSSQPATPPPTAQIPIRRFELSYTAVFNPA